MKDEVARAMLALVSDALGAIETKRNLLDHIAWPRDVEDRFFAGGASSSPEVSYSVDCDGINAENDELARLAKGIEGGDDEPIAVWLRAALTSAIDRNRLLLAVGTKEFGRLSIEIYGGARTAFFGLGRRNVDLADHLLERVRLHGWDQAKDRDEVPMTATELAATFKRGSIVTGLARMSPW